MGYRKFLIGVLLFATVATPHALAFDCVETKCPQMKSCAEAHHKLTVCGHSKRDADRDGIPCEDICGKDMTTYLARVGAQQPKSSTAAAPKPAGAWSAVVTPAEAADDLGAAGEKFTCSGKRTCKQMFSCDEAKYYLRSCGVKSLDGDNDGVPCNSLCRGG